MRGSRAAVIDLNQQRRSPFHALASAHAWSDGQNVAAPTMPEGVPKNGEPRRIRQISEFSTLGTAMAPCIPKIREISEVKAKKISALPKETLDFPATKTSPLAGK